MLEGFNWILFPLTAIAIALVGSVLSFWVWSRPFAEDTIEADRRALVGRWLVVVCACAAWCEVTAGPLADWVSRAFRMDTMRAAHVALLTPFCTTVAILIITLFTVHGNRTWAGRRVRIASIALLVIGGIGSALFLAVQYFWGP